jgi:hypothetical protein
MNPAEARRRMRDALASGRMIWSFHAGQRGAQRSVQVADIKDALMSAPLPKQSTTNPGEAWLFTGQTETGAELCVVVGYDNEHPTVVSAWWKT